MYQQNDLVNRIEKKYNKLSKGQKLLAKYVMEHYDKAVFLTAARLGNIVGVSESTVVRFANELGYSGYPRFQDALEELVKTKLTSIQRVEVTADHIDHAHVLRHVLHSDMDKIKTTLEGMKEEDFNRAIDYLLDAKRCYIIGVRSSASLANFLGFYFNLMFDNVKVINTNSVSEMFEHIHRVNKDDVVIGITFPRYSRRTLKGLEYAQNREAKVITITDSRQSPCVQYSDVALLARTDMASVVDSLVAPMSVINAIIVAMSLKRKDRIRESLERLESIWREYEVYEKTKSEEQAKMTKNQTVSDD